MRLRLVILIAIPLLLLGLLLWRLHSRTTGLTTASDAATPTAVEASVPSTPATTPTSIYAHNLMLRKGPNFRVYVRWLRGQMVRTRRGVNPTFDDPESFNLEIKAGVVRANIGDIGNFLNAGGVVNSPLKNITLLADGDQIKLTGTLHKLISFPVEVKGTIAAASDNRIQMHVTKINVL
jgi:hypothetical protein